MYLKPVDQHGIIKCLLHRPIAIYMQDPLRAMPKVFMPMDQLNREKMIHMGMGDQQMLDLPQPQMIVEGMCVCIRRKIDEELPVHHGLRSGTHLLPSHIPRPSTSLTVAEQGRQPLCRRSSQILYFHSVLLSPGQMPDLRCIHRLYILSNSTSCPVCITICPARL